MIKIMKSSQIVNIKILIRGIIDFTLYINYIFKV